MTPPAPDELPKPPTSSERPLTAHSLVQNAGRLWDEATRAPFLEALAAGTLPVEAFRRWLAQDYLFAKDPTASSRSSSPKPHVTAIRLSSAVLGTR